MSQEMSQSEQVEQLVTPSMTELVNADGRVCVKLPGMRLKYGVIKGSSTHRRLVSQGKIPIEGSGWVKPSNPNGRWRYTPRTENRTMVRRLNNLISHIRTDPDTYPFLSDWITNNFDKFDKKDSIVRIQKFRSALPALKNSFLGRVHFTDSNNTIPCIIPYIIPSTLVTSLVTSLPEEDDILKEFPKTITCQRGDTGFQLVLDTFHSIPMDTHSVTIDILASHPTIVDQFCSVLEDGGRRKRKCDNKK
jgi:hypothetical protein